MFPWLSQSLPKGKRPTAAPWSVTDGVNIVGRMVPVPNGSAVRGHARGSAVPPYLEEFHAGLIQIEGPRLCRRGFAERASKPYRYGITL